MSDRRQLTPRLLLSFFYFTGIDLEELIRSFFQDEKPDLFIDSGAFSAWSQDSDVDLQDYANFLNRWGHLANVRATLDVIGNAEVTRENTLYLRAQGLEVLDVFHVGEPWAVLERMCDESDYVGLGGMVPHAKDHEELRTWISRCFDIGSKHGTRFHGLGMTRWKNMRDFPWRSVDSSSWGQGFVWGQIPVFDVDRGRWLKISTKDTIKAFRAAKVLKKYYGVSAADLVLDDRWNRDVACSVAAMSYCHAEAWINARRSSPDFACYLVTWPPRKKESASDRFVNGYTQWRIFSELHGARLDRNQEGTWRLLGSRRKAKRNVKEKIGRRVGKISVT